MKPIRALWDWDKGENVMDWVLTFIILGYVAFIGLILLFIFAGKVIISHIKSKLLAKRGYYQIRHIAEDGFESLFFLKPKEEKYDIKDGIFIHMPDARTRSSSVVAPAELSKDEAKMQELVGKMIFNSKRVTWRFGIPTLTYYGDNPQPVDFSSQEKTYSAKALKSLYLQILLTRNFKLLNKYLFWIAIGAGVTAVCLIGLYYGFRGNVQNLQSCQVMLNGTIQYLQDSWAHCGVNITQAKIQIQGAIPGVPV